MAGRQRKPSDDRNNWRFRSGSHEFTHAGGRGQGYVVSPRNIEKTWFLIALVSVMVLPLAAMQIKGAGVGIDNLGLLHPTNEAEPLPGVYYYDPSIVQNRPPLSFMTVKSDRSLIAVNRMVSFRHMGTQKHIVDVYVPAGGSVRVPIPVGYYDMYTASGKDWKNAKDLFGRLTKTQKSSVPIVVNKNTENFISLSNQIDGNLPVENSKY